MRKRARASWMVRQREEGGSFRETTEAMGGREEE